MRHNPESAGVILHKSHVEIPGTIGTVHRYHAHLRSAFLKIKADFDLEVNHAEYLKLVVFSVTEKMGPEFQRQTTLVFGVINRPARKSPSLT